MISVLEVFGEPISNGGQESFVINTLLHMDRNDMKISLLTPYYCDNEYYRNIMGERGIEIYSFGLDFTPGKSRNNIITPFENFLKENQYDVVHVHSGSISVLTLIAKTAKKMGVKKVITHSHCAVERINLKNKVLRVLSSGTLNKNVDQFCACSKIAGEAKYLPSIVNSRMKVIKNGVDFNRFSFNPDIRSEIRRKTNIPDDAFVIGHVGRFSYQKNHEYLISIFSEYLKRDRDAILMLVGSGETEDAVRKQIDDFGIGDSVVFCGNVNEVQNYMMAMDVFCLPSRFEGLPIVGVEAQASGLPVIVSENVSSELYMETYVKYLPLSEDKEEWCDAIQKAKEDGRADNIAGLTKYGYNIKSTAEVLREMYTTNI